MFFFCFAKLEWQEFIKFIFSAITMEQNQSHVIEFVAYNIKVSFSL